jgi:hypothetical protein
LIAVVDLAPAKGSPRAPTDLAFRIGEEAAEYPLIPVQAGIKDRSMQKPGLAMRSPSRARAGTSGLWFESSET